MKAVIYSRVSTDEQNNANQVEQLTAWGKARGFAISEIYHESESAWRNGHQKELARLCKAARTHRFDTVLVWALDRLSRQCVRAILELIHNLNTWGVKVYSYQEAWTEAPRELGELLYALTGWGVVAEYESKRRSERTKAGLERLKAAGKTLGRPLGL